MLPLTYVLSSFTARSMSNSFLYWLQGFTGVIFTLSYPTSNSSTNCHLNFQNIARISPILKTTMLLVCFSLEYNLPHWSPSWHPCHSPVFSQSSQSYPNESDHCHISAQIPSVAPHFTQSKSHKFIMLYKGCCSQLQWWSPVFFTSCFSCPCVFLFYDKPELACVIDKLQWKWWCVT